MVKKKSRKKVGKSKKREKVLYQKGTLKAVLKKYNNKGRKGDYVYIKEPKRKAKIYKHKKRELITTYLEYYKRGIVSKRGGVSRKKVKRERNLDRVAKRYPKVESVLKKGYAEYTIRNAKELTPQRITLSYRSLLLNKDKVGDGLEIVRDGELLDILIRSENIERWKGRVLFEVKIENQRGEIMATINNTGIKTLAELKREVIDELKIGQEYQEQYKVFDGIKARGYRVNEGTTRDGKVGNISVKMVFRKGR